MTLDIKTIPPYQEYYETSRHGSVKEHYRTETELRYEPQNKVLRLWLHVQTNCIAAGIYANKRSFSFRARPEHFATLPDSERMRPISKEAQVSIEPLQSCGCRIIWKMRVFAQRRGRESIDLRIYSYVEKQLPCCNGNLVVSKLPNPLVAGLFVPERSLKGWVENAGKK